MQAVVPYEGVRAHQEAAIRSSHAGKTTLVSTGTGSGKTEAFLYPIISRCLELQDAGAPPGVLAVLIYPMNALAEDQLDRLRGLPAGRGIPFGTYVGKTPEEEAQVRGERTPAGTTNAAYNERLAQGREAGEASAVLPPEERASRKAMRADGGQPRILLTNVKQLELLLTRGKDVGIFAGAPLESLVFDEAHTFRGAQGAETACLIRRLRTFCSGRPDQVRHIATSATMADPEGGDAAAVDFARRFFGVTLGVDGDRVTLVREVHDELRWNERRRVPVGPPDDPHAVLSALLQAVDAPDDEVADAVSRQLVELGGARLRRDDWQDWLASQHYCETWVKDFGLQAGVRAAPEGGDLIGTTRVWEHVPAELGGSRVVLVDRLVVRPDEDDDAEEVDEDGDVLAPGAHDFEHRRRHPMFVCGHCGSLQGEHGGSCGACNVQGSLVAVQAVRSRAEYPGLLHSCVAWQAPGKRPRGGRYREPARPVRAVGVSDVHVLAQSMVHLSERARLLVFADNRQGAAFQAGWMRDHARRFRLRALMAQQIHASGASIGDVVYRPDDLLDEDRELSRALLPEVWQVVPFADSGTKHREERLYFLRIQVLREVATGVKQRLGLEPWGRLKVRYLGLTSELPFVQRWAPVLGVSGEALVEGVAALLDPMRRVRVLHDRTKLFETLWNAAASWGVPAQGLEAFLEELWAALRGVGLLVRVTLTGWGKPLEGSTGVYRAGGGLGRSWDGGERRPVNEGVAGLEPSRRQRSAAGPEAHRSPLAGPERGMAGLPWNPAFSGGGARQRGCIAGVDPGLDRRQRLGVVEHVAEAALEPQVLLHRLAAADALGDPALAVDDLLEHHAAGLHRHPGGLDGVAGLHAPAGGAGAVAVDVGGAADLGRALGALDEVQRVGDRGGGDVGDPVGGDDLDHVLAQLGQPLLAALQEAHRGGRGAGPEGRGPAPLAAGVHVALVVEAHVDEVLVSLHRPRERGQADVGGAPVAGDHQEVDPVAPPHHTQRGVDAGGDRGGVLEEHVEVRDLGHPHLHHHRQTPGLVDDDGPRPEGLQHVAEAEGLRAPRAGEVALVEVLLGGDLSELGHHGGLRIRWPGDEAGASRARPRPARGRRARTRPARRGRQRRGRRSAR